MTTKTKLDPREIHAEALALLERRRQELSVARAHREELRARINASDNSVTAQDLALAAAGIDLCERRIHPAARAEQRARTAIPADPALAQAVASSVASAIGCDVIVSDTKPATAPEYTPAGVLVPFRTTISRSGSMSGELHLFVVRSPLQGSIDADRLGDALNAHGLLQTTASSQGSHTIEGGKAVAEKFALRIGFAAPDMPVIDAEISPARAKAAGAALSGRFPVAVAGAVDLEPGYVQEIGDGIRAVELVGTLTAQGRSPSFDRSMVAAILPSVAEAWRSVFLPNVGRIVEAEITNAEPVEPQGVKARVTVVAQAKVAA